MGQSVSTYRDSRSYLKAAERGEADKVASSLHTTSRQAKLHLLQARKRSYERDTALHLAAKHGYLHVLRMILEETRSWSLTPDFSSWALMNNMGNSIDEVIESLVNSRNYKGQTPLMYAASKGHSTAVSFLLENGADPWAADRCGCRTALHYAASSGHADVMKLLLDHASSDAGTNSRPEFPNLLPTRYIDVRSDCGFAPLHHAIVHDQPSCVELLVSLGANLTFRSLYDGLDWIRCTKGSSALHLAARKGHLEMCKLLIRAQAELWPSVPDLRLALDAHGYAPYTLAVQGGHWQVAELLQPSTPLSAIQLPGELRLLGPPRLAQLAAKAVQQKLLAALQQLDSGAARAAAGTDASSVQPQEQQEEQQPEQACSSSRADVASLSNQQSASTGPVTIMLLSYQRHDSNALGSSVESDACAFEPSSISSCCSTTTEQSVTGMPGMRPYCEDTCSEASLPLNSVWVMASDAGSDAGGLSQVPSVESEACGFFGEDMDLELQGDLQQVQEVGEEEGAVQQGASGGARSAAEAAAACCAGAAASAACSSSAAVQAGLLASGAGGEEDGEDVCGVCMDAASTVELRPCGHLLCVACTTELATAMTAKASASCPFCRGLFADVGWRHA